MKTLWLKGQEEPSDLAEEDLEQARDGDLWRLAAWLGIKAPESKSKYLLILCIQAAMVQLKHQPPGTLPRGAKNRSGEGT